MKNLRDLRVLAVVAVLGMGAILSGCKSSPELTASQAQALIQAKYDQDPPVGANIRLHDLGMQKGVTAKYWDRSKAYPNKFWADFTLTADGKKAVILPVTGDVIQWRPQSLEDKNFSVVVTTVVKNHLKAHDVKDPQEEGAETKTAVFNEAVDLTGVPPALQDMAHDPGNRLATRRTATFTLDGGAWKLQSIN